VITNKSKKVEKLIGETILLIKDGRVDEVRLKKEKIFIDELKAKLRLQGVFSI
jgi:uncharacterized membrane protein YcaP (DUF421 family)